MSSESLKSSEGGPKTVADFVRKFHKLNKELPTYASLIKARDDEQIPENAFVHSTDAWLSDFTEPEDIAELNELFNNLGYAESDEERKTAAKALAM